MTKRPAPSGERLLVFFQPVLSLSLLEGSPGRQFAVDGTTYLEAGHGDLTGFYDWLRSPAGRILGVRYFPDPNASAFRLDRVRGLTYAAVDDSMVSVSVFFSEDRSFQRRSSDDQAFGGNAIYVGPNGELAVTFETYFLSEDEVASIRKAEARWVALEGT